MKVKTDLVTNSSCASFVIPMENLTKLQIYIIKNHIEFANRFMSDSYGEQYDKGDAWTIEELDGNLYGDTNMDNFDMLWFLTEIGLESDKYKYEGCY